MHRPTDLRREGVSTAGPTWSAPRRLRFRSFELDTEAGELRHEGQPVRLQQQPCKVLALLAGRAGELVTRDEIRRSVWGADTYVNFDQGLNFCIKEIRAALGDQADTPTFIETLPRRGYRFIAEVEESTAESASAAPVADDTAGVGPVPPTRRGTSRPLLIALALALALAAAAGVTRVGRDGAERAVTPADRQMLAVLPFENLSADPAQDYLGDGLTEEMITQIGRLQPDRLGVIARTSAMQYRSRNKDVGQIGAELGVDYVVEGSVRRGEDRIRITVKLIQVSDQTQLWAEAYDRAPDDLLAVQREVAEAAARSIQLILSDGAQARLERAVRFFERSVATDPDMARLRIREAVEHPIEREPDLPEAQPSIPSGPPRSGGSAASSRCPGARAPPRRRSACASRHGGRG